MAVFELVSHLPCRGIAVACDGRNTNPGDQELLNHVGNEGFRRRSGLSRALEEGQWSLPGRRLIPRPCAPRKSATR